MHQQTVTSMRASSEVEGRREDPMRRFISTPYAASLPVMGRTVRLETNSSTILKHMVELFAPYADSSRNDPSFLWRIVVESDVQTRPPWPARFAFSCGGLRFVEFGQRNFLAVDLESREGIGILSEGLAQDEVGLTSPYLDNLFCLTVGSLRLVPLWANCVARGQKGVLMFGASDSGKTCAGYVAENFGLDFHADEGVFLEVDAGILRGWGGFWPAALRPETLQFFPELKEYVRPCLYCNQTAYHVTREYPRRTLGLSVTPACCLFLERQASAVPILSRILHDDLTRRLAESVLFKDDARFADQQSRIMQALGEVPAYVLRYGNDPSIAAAVARDLLADHYSA